MHSPRLATLGLSVALLGLLAHLALAGPADNVSSLVRQGTVITVDAHDQATLQLDDGTTFTVPEKPWQHGWKVAKEKRALLGEPSYETILHTLDSVSCRSVHSDRLLLEQLSAIK